MSGTQTTFERVYLAGPEVFLPTAEDIARQKKSICRRHGYEGVFPLDSGVDLNGLTGPEAGFRISQANETLIRSCDLLIANLTPFRGPSADVGTAYELGFMRGLGRPVYAYSNEPRLFTERTVEDTGARRGENGWTDHAGLAIEDFELIDNLMLDGAVRAAGTRVVLGDVTDKDRYSDLTAFTECVRLARQSGPPATSS